MWNSYNASFGDVSSAASDGSDSSATLGAILNSIQNGWDVPPTVSSVVMGGDPAAHGTISGSASAAPANQTNVQVTTLSNGSALVGASGGLQFHLNWDSSVSSAPADFKNAAITAAGYFTQMYSNAEVININIGYGEVDGISIPSGDLSDSIRAGSYKSYSSVVNALEQDQDASNSALQALADSTLPATDPYDTGRKGFGGQPVPDYYVSYAEQKALGMFSPTGTEVDGYIGISKTQPMDYTPPTGSGQYDGVGAFEHEISEVMGRFGSVGAVYGNGMYTPMDLFRYASPGVRDKTGTAPSPYFSIDGGATNLAPYDTVGADPADWASLIRGDAFGYGYPGVTDTVSPVDVATLAVLGYNMTPAGLAATHNLPPLA